MVPAGRMVMLPLAVLGGLLALLSAERLQLWQSGRQLSAALLLLGLPLGCVGLGWMGARWLTRLDGAPALRALVAVGVALGVWAYFAARTASWTVLAETGLVALVVAPGVVTLLLLAMRPRARSGSLLARASKRTSWFVVGGVGCGGALLALPDWYGLRTFYQSGTFLAWSVVAVALLTLGLCLLSSARDLGRARRACRDEGLLQPVAAGQVSSTTVLLDIGVGSRLLGDVTEDGTAYRTRQQVARVVVGDPALGAGRLGRAHRRLLWGCLAAAASVSLAAVGSLWMPALRSALTGAALAPEQAPRPVSERMPGGAGLQTLKP